MNTGLEIPRVYLINKEKRYERIHRRIQKTGTIIWS